MLADFDVVDARSHAADRPRRSRIFTTWVNGGGNLIAMRPDKTAGRPCSGSPTHTTTRATATSKVDTSQAPGAGIDGQTMQFHGTADRYALSGAERRRHALLEHQRRRRRTRPSRCVTSAPVGGQAAAFTFDLPQSIVYTRQGNPVVGRH